MLTGALRSAIAEGARGCVRAGLVLGLAPVLAGCIYVFAATTDTYYRWDGRTFLVQVHSSNVSNVTLFEVVEDRRTFLGYVDLDGNVTMTALRTGPIPEETGHRRTIMRVLQEGEQIGEPERRVQRGFDLDIKGGE